MKAVLLNGGGTLYSLIRMIEIDATAEIHSLTVDLGQLNIHRVLPAAKALADEYCVSHTVIKMPLDLTYPSERWEGFRENPCQNIFYHTLGAMRCRAIGAKYILSGIDEESATPEFNKRFIDLLKTSNNAPWIPIPINPGMNIDRPIKQEYLKNHKLSKLTASCIWPEPCGKCGKCKLRLEYGIGLN